MNKEDSEKLIALEASLNFLQKKVNEFRKNTFPLKGSELDDWTNFMNFIEITLEKIKELNLINKK